VVKTRPLLSSLRRLASITVAAPVLGFPACSPPAPTQAVPTAQQAATNVAAVRTQGSGTVQSAAAPAVATAQAVGTPVLATAQAAATAVAATLQAAAAQVATSLPPTVAALATQAAGTLQPAVATTVAASRVQISQASVNQNVAGQQQPSRRLRRSTPGACCRRPAAWGAAGAGGPARPTNQHLPPAMTTHEHSMRCEVDSGACNRRRKA